jgi:hypothetical protein
MPGTDLNPPAACDFHSVLFIQPDGKPVFSGADRHLIFLKRKFLFKTGPEVFGFGMLGPFILRLAD